MAEDPRAILERFREELVTAGYGAVVQEHLIATEGDDHGPQEALEDLIGRLQGGVVAAMHAHAASIRNLKPRPGPRRGPLWEPPPSRLSVPTDEAGEEFAININDEDAARIEKDASDLDRLLSQLRGDADEG